MSFQEKQARFKRLNKEDPTWSLLRAKNSPHILAFVADLFSTQNEIPVGRAKAALEAELKNGTLTGVWETNSKATTYLRNWIDAGWLRELDDTLSKTNACEVALRFCRSLDHKDSSITASHLRTVQEAVSRLAIAVNPNPEEKIEMLEVKLKAIQNEIDDLLAGNVKPVSDGEVRDGLREIYQLASVLTGDFRLIEDEIRQLEKDLRVQMIKEGASKGNVLRALIDKEALVSETDAGQAFEGFFQLIMDNNLSDELREQIKLILSHPSSKSITKEQRIFLNYMVRELSKETTRIIKVRRRMEESLRYFIDSGAHLENQAVNHLLQELEQVAVHFKDTNLSLSQSLNIVLDSGNITVKSLDGIKLRVPEDKIDTSDVVEVINSYEPSTKMLGYLNAVQIKKVASNMKNNLIKHGPMTISELANHEPIKQGLEELVALIRVAKSVNATELPDTEDIIFIDRNGDKVKAKIPKLLVSVKQFPDELGELEL